MASRKKMNGYDDYLGQPFGLSRIMDESPFTDGSGAALIENWHVDERGFLVNEPRIMSLVPHEWDPYDEEWSGEPSELSSTMMMSILRETTAIGFLRRDGEVPEMLFISERGCYRFAPWARNITTAWFGSDRGLVEQKHFPKSGGSNSVRPVSSPKSKYPPQIEVVNNQMYFTFGNAGGVWMWDGKRVKQAGFSMKPNPPDAQGPMRSSKTSNISQNSGGFSYPGRIGNAESNWTQEVGTTPTVKTVGGVDVGQWRYAVVFEGSDGSYSAMSDPGGNATFRKQVCQDEEYPDQLLKKFRVFSIPTGPDNCVARILLRTRNLERLPPGDDGSFRFLHRIPNDMATEYIDDVPDGELGAEWQDREEFPLGPNFLRHFSGSMFYASTDAHPSRIWWSEQEPASGPITESILFGHWMDVFPETGPITGLYSAVLPGQQSVPILLVFKENATHFIGGEYPNWQCGTLHNNAGCAGPGAVHGIPTGEVVWYGSNTFWKLGKEGIEDVGVSIRKRLSRINRHTAKLAVSWFDSKNKEVVFWLPLDDAAKPNQGFVWDYKSGGWRLLTSLADVSAALSLPSQQLVLVNATYGNEEAGEPVHYHLWAYGRSYYGDEVVENVTVTATYRSGWLMMGDFGASMHAAKRGSWLVVTGEEQSAGSSVVSVFKNHDGTTRVTEPQPIPCSHPEESVPYFDQVLYDVGVWRSPRVFSVQAPIDAPNARTIQVEMQAKERMMLFNIDLYGPVVSGPFSKVPGGEG